MDFAFMWRTFLTLVEGVPLLLELAGLSLAAGAAFALLLATMRLSGVRVLDWTAQSYVFVFRGTPLLVQIFLIYYGLGQFRPALQDIGLWWFFREPFYCAFFALTLNSAAYSAEIVRGGILSVPHGQIEAAKACGMSRLMRFRRITLPIALRQALPAYGNEIILMVKATSLASVITLMEVTGLAHRTISQTFRAVEVFVVAGAIYLFINFAVTRVILFLEWRLSPHLRRPPAAPALMKPAPAQARGA